MEMKTQYWDNTIHEPAFRKDYWSVVLSFLIDRINK